MKRFLGSLTVHVDESVNDLAEMKRKYQAVNDEFSTIKRVAQTTVFSNYDKRKITHRSFTSLENNNRNYKVASKSEPKYIPASQFAVPMQPRLFKPKLPSLNARRVAKLSKMREVKVEIETSPQLPDDSSKLPPIDVEIIGIV